MARNIWENISNIVGVLLWILALILFIYWINQHIRNRPTKLGHFRIWHLIVADCILAIALGMAGNPANYQSSSNNNHSAIHRTNSNTKSSSSSTVTPKSDQKEEGIASSSTSSKKKTKPKPHGVLSLSDKQIKKFNASLIDGLNEDQRYLNNGDKGYEYSKYIDSLYYAKDRGLHVKVNDNFLNLNEAGRDKVAHQVQGMAATQLIIIGVDYKTDDTISANFYYSDTRLGGSSIWNAGTMKWKNNKNN
ncbi:hypothetical protein IWT140_00568 [Secundilactobacillus pentosiphilus]|uniref:Uncharacterized protein n=1 Tax=Secundilactobacillus pentosiphilus TaxID=1714682 RepID=A0A1Z5IMH7_9LACO|nr:hypothetical protein [Secundilactobacillus pentosiphilus]GAX02970.1 hypothetical protein IWT140_00568 [Secundilactobacillus pentosiphilus]